MMENRSIWPKSVPSSSTTKRRDFPLTVIWKLPNSFASRRQVTGLCALSCRLQLTVGEARRRDDDIDEAPVERQEQ